MSCHLWFLKFCYHLASRAPPWIRSAWICKGTFLMQPLGFLVWGGGIRKTTNSPETPVWPVEKVTWRARDKELLRIASGWTPIALCSFTNGEAHMGRAVPTNIWMLALQEVFTVWHLENKRWLGWVVKETLLQYFVWWFMYPFSAHCWHAWGVLRRCTKSRVMVSISLWMATYHTSC